MATMPRSNGSRREPISPGVTERRAPDRGPGGSPLAECQAPLSTIASATAERTTGTGAETGQATKAAARRTTTQGQSQSTPRAECERSQYACQTESIGPAGIVGPEGRQRWRAPLERRVTGPDPGDCRPHALNAEQRADR